MIKNVGKKQPSKKALDKFIEIYKKMVKGNKEKDDTKPKK